MHGTNENKSVVEGSFNKGTIESKSTYENQLNQISSDVGGIIGVNWTESYVTNSYNEGIIKGNGRAIGGIVGSLTTINAEKDFSIENCYNTGKVIDNGKDGQIGGICGSAIQGAKIKKCYNKGIITGTMGIGGIVGHLGYEGNKAYIENCYNVGKITAESNCVGGIAGLTYNGEILNSYNIGQINLNSSSNSQGGIMAYNTNTIYYNVINSYYLNTTSSGAINETDIEGNAESRTSSEMKEEAFLNLLNEDNEGVWKNDIDNINNGYPILTWQEDKR